VTERQKFNDGVKQVFLCINKLCLGERVRRSAFNRKYDGYVVLSKDKEELRSPLPQFHDV
jgi:hypothetical protein